jgi:glutamyl-Q tRNA(Asp) synthetase
VLAAAASYLHAKQAGGEWLLRIEDIDPPREAPGAAASIQAALERLGLLWDRGVLFQSTHLELYRAVVRRLLAEGLAFRCSCSRSDLQAYAAGHTGAAAHPGAPAYPGTCRHRAIAETEPSAVRLRVDASSKDAIDDVERRSRFASARDGLQGRIEPAWLERQGDYVIERRDGLPAYHLAVVVDDAIQGVTTVVRGCDLLESTAVHCHLQRTLRVPTPAYFHVPILTGEGAVKLSKQTGAAAVDLSNPSRVASEALERLGAAAPKELAGAPPAELWEWAVAHWRVEKLAGLRSSPLGGRPELDCRTPGA